MIKAPSFQLKQVIFHPLLNQTRRIVCVVMHVEVWPFLWAFDHLMCSTLCCWFETLRSFLLQDRISSEKSVKQMTVTHFSKKLSLPFLCVNFNSDFLHIVKWLYCLWVSRMSRNPNNPRTFAANNEIRPANPPPRNTVPTKGNENVRKRPREKVDTEGSKQDTHRFFQSENCFSSLKSFFFVSSNKTSLTWWLVCSLHCILVCLPYKQPVQIN